jgi:hypothetical protein
MVPKIKGNMGSSLLSTALKGQIQHISLCAEVLFEPCEQLRTIVWVTAITSGRKVRRWASPGKGPKWEHTALSQCSITTQVDE